MTTGERIQKQRKKKNFTQEQFAEMLGVTRQAVSKWESDQSLPEIDKIMALSDLFEVSTDYILKGVDSVSQVESKQPENTLSI